MKTRTLEVEELRVESFPVQAGRGAEHALPARTPLCSATDPCPTRPC